MKVTDFIRKNRSFLLGVFVLLSFRWSLADQYRVPSGSMEPNIQVGDHIAVNKMAYDLKIPFTEKILLRLSEPKRGDVVVFIWPVDHSTVFVKRLVGLPGDHVQIKNGFITINGEEISHADLNWNQSTQHYREAIDQHDFVVQRLPLQAKEENLDFSVPQDQYFFMGDNRDNSSDSRVWGFVKREALKGKAIGVLWNIRFDQIIPEVDLSRSFGRLL